MFAFLLWLCVASHKALPFNFSILTYLYNRSANYLLIAQPVKGGFPSAMSCWLYPSHMCYVSAAHQPAWAGHRDPFVISEVHGTYGNEAWQRSKTQYFISVEVQIIRSVS